MMESVVDENVDRIVGALLTSAMATWAAVLTSQSVPSIKAWEDAKIAVMLAYKEFTDKAAERRGLDTAGREKGTRE